MSNRRSILIKRKFPICFCCFFLHPEKLIKNGSIVLACASSFLIISSITMLIIRNLQKTFYKIQNILLCVNLCFMCIIPFISVYLYLIINRKFYKKSKKASLVCIFICSNLLIFHIIFMIFSIKINVQETFKSNDRNFDVFITSIFFNIVILIGVLCSFIWFLFLSFRIYQACQTLIIKSEKIKKMNLKYEQAKLYLKDKVVFLEDLETHSYQSFS